MSFDVVIIVVVYDVRFSMSFYVYLSLQVYLNHLCSLGRVNFASKLAFIFRSSLLFLHTELKALHLFFVVLIVVRSLPQLLLG